MWPFTNQQLDRIERKVNRIMSQLDDANAALAQINDATNSIATVTQTISDELDAALAGATPGSQITPEFLDGLKATAGKAAALVPVLQGIAAKGASNPVPVPVPTP